MDRIGEKALKKLLSKAEKSKSSKNKMTLKFTTASFPSYSKINNKDKLNEVHAYLENAQKDQAITIEWQKNQMGIQIERIRLGTIETLATYLGLKTIIQRIEQAEEKLSSILPMIPPWLSKLYTDVIKEKWYQSRKAFGLSPEDSQILSDVFKLIIHLEKYGTQDLDRRSLSTKIYQNSKYIEKSLEGKLVQIYKHHLNNSDLLADEILADLGLFKHPLPLLVKGNISLVVNGQQIKTNNISPYIGIPPDAIETIFFEKNPSYCLSIENLSSFNAYTRNIHDEAIVLYSNGFPGSKWQASYKKLLLALPKNTPVFHWGDIDVGGFRILQKLQEYAKEIDSKLIVFPHLMQNKDVVSKNQRLSVSEINILEKIIKRHPSWTLTDIPKHKQEQETLSPKPPY